MSGHPITRVTELLSRKNIPYCLIGGYAVAVHGEPRSTDDLDLMVIASREEIKALLALLKEQGWEAELNIADFRDPVGDVLRIRRPFFCDIIRAKNALDRKCVQEAAVVPFMGENVRIVTAENLILLLLRAGDPRSIYDIWGIVSVLKARKTFDQEKLMARARKHRLDKRLVAVLDGKIPWPWGKK